jgi:pimeloyl-ACP methyl ester carboxylesterase
MKRRTGVIGGAAGVVAAAATAAVLVAVDRSAAMRRRDDPDQPEEFAPLPADRSGVLVAEDGTGLYYEEVGPVDAPLTVVFVHGYTLALGAFHYQRLALQERFGAEVRAVYYDQRSHGRSDRSGPENSSIEQLGQDLATVLTTLVPRGPIVLVGHSMGGMTVMALADSHPELFPAEDGDQARVVAVALISTSAGQLRAVTLGLPAPFGWLTGPVVPLLLRGARSQAGLVERGRRLGADVAWVITRRLSFDSDDIDPAVVEYLADMIAATRIEVVADFFGSLRSHDRLAALPVLSHVPVLVLCGDHDLLTPPAHSQAIAAALPHARLVIVPRAGHVVVLERPKIVSDELADLIEKALADQAPRSSRGRS